MSGDSPRAEADALAPGEVEAVLETLRSTWLTMGPQTQALEQAFAEAVGAEHAVAVSSGTAGLHLALLAAGVAPGDDVLVPAIAPVSVANAAVSAGARPVFCDIESPDSPFMSGGGIEAAATDLTRAAIAVHLFGHPTDASALRATCDEHGMALIEDCGGAVGATDAEGRSLGLAGSLGVFSFASGPLATGEGGIVVSGSEEAAGVVRSLRSHAMTTVTWERHKGKAETYDVTDLGFNYRIDEPRAALAAARLGRIDELIDARRGRAAAICEQLAAVSGVAVPAGYAADRACPSHVSLLFADRTRRDTAADALHSAGLDPVVMRPLGSQVAYATAAEDSTPIADAFADRHLALPLSPSLGNDETRNVASALESALA